MTVQVPLHETPDTPPICDYEGSGYQAEFWQGRGRDYEDQAERIALRTLLPAGGRRCAEFGAGFGRLSDELRRFDQVVLVDYSRSLLQQARAHLGNDPRYIFVAADVNTLPFAPDAFDAATLIRVIHHSAAPLTTLRSIRATLTDSAAFVLEFANKRNLKAIARYWLGRQQWNPFDREAVEFVTLNFDFHPATMGNWLYEAGFSVGQKRAVSMLRADAIKKRLPLNAMLAIDRLMQPTGAILPLSPSVFVRCTPIAQQAVNGTSHSVVPFDRLFVNPNQRDSVLRRDGDWLVCPQTGARWPIHDGLYDFKAASVAD